MTLACHLDRLEVLHFLDLHNADLSGGAGKFLLTPLMAAQAKWNVRIIDYLMERGVDPNVPDKYGFTAKQKAEIRQLRTISSMMAEYEEKFNTKLKRVKPQVPVTNEYWARQL